MLSAYRSDFYLMKSLIGYYLKIQVLMIFLAIIYSSQYFYLFSSNIISLMLLTSSNLNALSNGYSGILLSSPISRKNIVTGRYLFVLSFSIIMVLLSCLVMFILGDATAYETIRLIIIQCAFLITLQSIFTPLSYILKPNHISVAFLFICFMPSLLVLLLKPFIESSDFNMESLILTIESIYNSLTTLSLILLASIVLLAISMTISITVFKKKEF